MGSLVFAAVLALMVPPSPTPIPAQTEAPLFDNAHFFYQGEDNNPKKHPVPPEYQSGPKRDWHIRCLDWYRLPKNGKSASWRYDKTTCECWSSATLR